MKLEDEIKQKEFKSEYNKAIVNMIYTFNWMDAKSRSFFEPYGLTPQQFNILRILRGQFPQPATVNLLKERMLDKMCDASRIVERLRLKGLLERNTCQNDRRAVDIKISEQGLKLLDEIDSGMNDFDNMLSLLTSDEVSKLNELLDKLRG
ncbi:MAG TPA: MarR family transcriptional regulator [Cytophagaceae bacterium]|jgi:DNA-binding MarR family transcriptional regulator